MCVVCVELIKHKMTILEAERNLGELVYTEKDKSKSGHYQRLFDAIVNSDWKGLDRILDEEEPEESNR